MAGSEFGPQFTIVGTGFTNATSVKIGDNACADFTIVSDTHIVCKGPNASLTTGSKTVTVTTDGITSDTTASVSYASTSYPTLQASNAYANCTTTAKIFRDTRDSQLYYVKRMEDNKCWMVDNLKYAGFGELSQEEGKYLTADGTSTQSTENSDVAKYVDPGATTYCIGTDGKPTNTATECGYLYNWYAATSGTGTYNTSTAGNQASGSICPTNFRLPSGISGASGPTTNGTVYTTADFPVLNASMNAGSLATGSTTSYPTGWQPSGAWGGSFSGRWLTGLSTQGSYGYFWSSTAHSASNARSLFFSSGSVFPGNNADGKYLGYAVRCVMDDPATIYLPEGANPDNIVSTNPAVLDVYPTTGWKGDTIAITSNALFTNVTNVTIGGTACLAYEVISTSLIACNLPAKTAGTTNNIVVTNAGSNVTNAATYTHMKITYFDPNSSTVSIGGTTYNYYPNGFTSTNCSSMTASNAVIGSTPAASIAYFRDTRNKQVYKVKKMIDGKCWMVDNLKYKDAAITYNNGDHLANGGSGAYNTIDESGAQSATNSNKKFYNNPMSAANCYNTTYAPVNSLTRCGYLYNWYAATNGTGTYNTSTQGNQVSGNICPTNFRLPSGMSGASGPTTNGTVYATADFPVLNASMAAGALTTGNTTSSNYAGWYPSGAWGGSFSGGWNASLYNQGSSGLFWSSTANSAPHARNLYFYSSNVLPGNSSVDKHFGYAVRCVVADPAHELPEGSNPDNITSTNPAVMDVYPSTGWTGDVVAITSNALFTNVSSVTIGGTSCSAYTVVNSSLIACRLPAKTAGTTNDIVVTNNGTNVTNASTYTHMKVTYFSSSGSTVSVGGTSYSYYPNGFTSTNCSSMTASNAPIGTEPAESIAYVRDTRNKQVYRVKKMVDGKCWMVDNLKYKDAALTYNNGDHLANGGSGAYNTIDESDTQSATNSDKKFYNNPMSASGCYGTSNAPASSLTKCGYLYNWYAATNGTGTYNTSTNGNQVSGNICPTNFRLPSGSSGASGPTTNGTSANVADFPVLNASMNAGSLTTGATTNTFTAGWQSSGAWGGSFSGHWRAGLINQGSHGFFWSSTAYSATSARVLYFNSSSVLPGSNVNSKYDGRAVRCVLP